MPFCEKCGSVVNESSSFCGECGAPMNIPAVAANESDTVQLLKCSICGAEMPFGERFCDGCGCTTDNAEIITVENKPVKPAVSPYTSSAYSASQPPPITSHTSVNTLQQQLEESCQPQQVVTPIIPAVKGKHSAAVPLIILGIIVVAGAATGGVLLGSGFKADLPAVDTGNTSVTTALPQSSQTPSRTRSTAQSAYAQTAGKTSESTDEPTVTDFSRSLSSSTAKTDEPKKTTNNSKNDTTRKTSSTASNNEVTRRPESTGTTKAPTATTLNSTSKTPITTVATNPPLITPIDSNGITIKYIDIEQTSSGLKIYLRLTNSNNENLTVSISELKLNGTAVRGVMTSVLFTGAEKAETISVPQALINAAGIATVSNISVSFLVTNSNDVSDYYTTPSAFISL